MESYFDTLKKYAVFSGRAGRAEYWTFFFINLLLYFAVAYSENKAGLPGTGFLTLTNIFSLLLMLPSLAVAVRRLHDTGRSGWWLLLAVIPILGFLALLVMYCLAGDPGDNDYGPVPVQPGAEMAQAPSSQEPPPPPSEQQNG
jgi:uncharacterized membrane protein YhaH (DUF805 family)